MGESGEGFLDVVLSEVLGMEWRQEKQERAVPGTEENVKEDTETGLGVQQSTLAHQEGQASDNRLQAT